MAVRATRKTRMGRVISNKMTNTVVVRVESTAQHPLYAKTLRRQRKFYAHDPKNECRVGDLVRIMETRPLSKLKRWLVVDVVEKARE